MAIINTDIAQKIDIVVRENNSSTINLTLTNSDNSVFDLTGYSLKFDIDKNNESLFTHTSTGSGTTINFSTPTNGKVVIFFTKDEMSINPGTYNYKLVLTKGTSVKTWMYGKFKINAN